MGKAVDEETEDKLIPPEISHVKSSKRILT